MNFDITDEEILECEYLKNPIAVEIWEEIKRLNSEYPDDSSFSKLFLPAQLCDYGHTITFSLTQIVVGAKPPKINQDVSSSKLYATYFLAAVCGMQVFLRERAILKDYASYSIRSGKREVEKIKKQVLAKFGRKGEVSEAAKEVMELLYHKVFTESPTDKFDFNGKRLKKQKCEQYFVTSVLWGYSFAKAMITEKQIWTDKKY